MRVLEVLAVGLILALLLLIAFFGRRELFARGRGVVELYFRLHHRPNGGGWSPGFARFYGDEMRWYRVFSLAWWPRRRLSRRGLAVHGRRSPTAEEAHLVPAEWVVLRCLSAGVPLEIAMPRHTVAGFLSWLESVTPYST